MRKWSVRRSDEGTPLVERAFSALEIKSVDEEKREIRGWATKPAPDRTGDIVEPLGLQFAKDIPLFLYHDSRMGVGRATLGPATKTGVPFVAHLPKVTELGKLKDMVDEAWQRLKYKLIQATSIGFMPDEDEVEALDSGGWRFKKAEVLELSLVPIPMHAGATIDSVKALYLKSISGVITSEAALGRYSLADPRCDLSKSPGASGKPITPASDPAIQRNKGKTMSTREEIASYEATRAATVAAMDNLVAKARDDGQRTFDDAEQQQYDDAEATITKVDKHLEVLRKHEKLMLTTATRIEPEAGKDPGKATEARNGVAVGEGVLRPNKNLPEGMPFVRYTMALAMAKGNIMQAQEIAKQWDTSTPEVGAVLDFAMRRGTTRVMGMIDAINKAAVAAGTTTATTWAAPLVQYNNMAQAFIDYLRPATILGRLQGMQRVPFYTRIPRQTAGSTGYFVGEGAPKPLSSLAFDSVTMEPFKAATIVVITTELARFSSPDAEGLVRSDMRRGVAQFLDARFIDPQYTGNASSPASITNGSTSSTVTVTTIAGTDAAIETALGTFLSADMDVGSLVWIMSPIIALSLSLKRNTNDEFAYPGLSASGGTWMGIPVITSNTAVLAGSPSEAIIVLLDTSNVLFADEGMDIDVSGEASVQMDSAPTGGAVSLVSLWQNNMLGFRAEQFINWKSRRATNPAYVLRYNLSPSGV